MLSGFDLSSAVVAALCGSIAYLLYQVVYYRFFHPLSVFPGPFWASVTRLWLTYHNVMGREVNVCAACHDKYGPVVRITPTMLLVTDYTKLPVIYHRYADKSLHYITGSTGPTEAIFNIQDHRAHARLRKLTAAPYSFTNIKKMEPLMDAQITHWITRIDELFVEPSSSGVLDLSRWAVYLAYDVVSELGFGAPFGFIEQGRDVGGLIRGFHGGLLAFGIMTRLYHLTYWLKSTWLRKYMIAKPEDESGFGLLMRFRDALVAKRIGEIAEGKLSRVDLLQTFIEARDENDKPLDMETVKAEVLLVLVAGAETTGTSIQALVQAILSNPRILEKVMAEIQAVEAAGKLSSPVAQYDEVIRNCPYYVACVNESLRLTSPVPSIFPRLVSEGGLELYGKYAPAGTEISANAQLVNRDTNLYGPDADEFRPERWLENEKKAQEYSKYSFTFGHGSRSCLGLHVARMEMYKAPLQLFRTFHLGLTGGKLAKYSVQGGVASLTDLWVDISRRK